MSILNGTRPDLIVVGGGPAGMAAALFAAEAGARVALLERNEKLGKKLYITGKGRCNLTNVAGPDETLASIVRNPRFLHSALSGFDATALRALMERLGVPTKVERGGRVFPISEKASDVTRGLEHGLERAGVVRVCGARVAGVEIEGGAVSGVRLERGDFVPCRGLVLATGGASYPATGSTGDGYVLAEALGHTVHPPKAALAPLLSNAAWVRSLQGLSLRNVRLLARKKGELWFDELGELLFTHTGVSGPLALTLSSYLADRALSEEAIGLDLKPGLSLEQLERRVLREIEENARRRVETVLAKLLPGRLAEAFPALAGVAAEKPVNQLSRAERRRIVECLKDLSLPIDGIAGLTEAVITRGGVEVREILPGTMASRRVRGLYFAGELIDVDALTGGFNLQIAFATGVCAGRAAAAWLAEEG